MSAVAGLPGRRLTDGARAAYPALLVGVLGLAVWELGVQVTGVQSFILSAPSGIAAALAENYGTILSATRITATAIAIGMLLGTGLGLLGALLTSALDRFADPVIGVAAIVSCAPVVALAPIFNAWFGATSIMSKAGVAAIMVFFPVYVNATRGLLRVSPQHRELMSSVSGTPAQLMWMVRVPGALPYWFNGMRIASTLCVIGVIVAEYFGGSVNALGVYIANTAALSQFASTWAGVVIASILGLTIYATVGLLERLCLPWERATS
ncbi:ABC transporter permease subunit [Georgenia sp. 10Sc9-8]|uniref:ABC transporter permease subunit n=1 Tax=Georgenia halotolerans TaxID=3028317 RepID=A0ABT5TUD2_9MICO|nr:ABC transporter permease subunit [Georgenia halotolerans]